MSVWRQNGISGKGAALGLGALIVLLVGAYVIVSQRPSPDRVASTPSSVVSEDVSPDTTEVSEQASQSATDPVASDTGSSATTGAVADSETESAAADLDDTGAGESVAPAGEATAEVTAKPEVEPVAVAPTFDVVRIDANGSAVVAGNAAPGALVSLRSGGDVVAEVTADQNGSFVALFDLAPSATPRNLELWSDGVAPESVTSILVSPIAKDRAEVAEADPVTTDGATVDVAAAASEGSEVEGEVIADGDGAVEESSASVASADQEPEIKADTDIGADTADVEPAAPTIVAADNSGVRVVQPAPQPQAPVSGPEVTANIVIDTISYDTDGEVALSGRGASTGFVRVYLNEEPIQTTSIGADGNWSAELPEVDAGVYRLRVDEVGSDGAVTSRMETPFKREEPEVVEGTIAAVTVQPGFTLWGIAQERFGDGVQYVRVYEANRELIRDPDLIYPGQVFTLPE